MKTSEDLNDWLAKKGITVYQLLSIAFVPRRTGEEILSKKERWLPATYRLFMVTNLDEFKLNDEEIIKYKNSKKEKPGIVADELICELFNRGFAEKGSTPKKEDSLVVSGNSRDKKVLTSTLMKKYFSAGVNSVQLPEGISVERSEALSALVSEFKRILTKDLSRINQYKSSNKPFIKELRALLSILLEENPKEAQALMIKAEKRLNQNS